MREKSAAAIPEQRRFSCLTNGCRNRNRHITQQAGCETRRMRCAGFPHGERQDVRGAVLAPKPAIETLHPPIADEREPQFRRRFPDFSKHGLHQSQEARLMNDN